MRKVKECRTSASAVWFQATLRPATLQRGPLPAPAPENGVIRWTDDVDKGVESAPVPAASTEEKQRRHGQAVMSAMVSAGRLHRRRTRPGGSAVRLVRQWRRQLDSAPRGRQRMPSHAGVGRLHARPLPGRGLRPAAGSRLEGIGTPWSIRAVDEAQRCCRDAFARHPTGVNVNLGQGHIHRRVLVLPHDPCVKLCLAAIGLTHRRPMLFQLGSVVHDIGSGENQPGPTTR